MKLTADNIIALYHGTTHDLAEIDVRRGKPFKDFGRGFYASQSREHAAGMAIRNRDIEIRRMDRRGIVREVTPWVYSLGLDAGSLGSLSVKRFEGADREWVSFVTENRTNDPHLHSYDIVIGPTADDQTNPTIQTYLNGGYGEVGSGRAVELLIEFLLPYNLPRQYFFGTERAAKLLVLQERSVAK